VYLMRRILQCSLVFAVAAALPSSSYGQAMVGYGINVARAGAAGVGGGAGVAGIFGKLGSTTKQAEQPPSGVARGRQPEFGEDDLKPTVIKLNTGSKSGASAISGKRKMSSGVTISGIPASSGGSAGSQATAVREVAPANSRTAAADEGYGYGSSAPGSYQPVSRVSSAGRSRADARPKPAENKPSVETAEKEILPEVPAAAAVESSSSRGSGSSASSVLTAPRNSTGISAGPVSVPADDGSSSADLGISVGDKVEQIIVRFGKPLMALKGISGQDYTEKYLFRTEDGLRITVLAVNGTVTAVLASARPLATRAALR
jgi:hypothetical protein